MKPMETVAIWNPASGGAPSEHDLRVALGHGVEIRKTTVEDPGTGQAEAAVAEGASRIVVCGGDGTVRACLAAVANTDTSLDIVALGTGNLLAMNLNIGSGIDGYDQAARGQPQTIDLATVNGEFFAVMAGTGFDAVMIRDAGDEAKSRFGAAAYVFSGARNLLNGLVSTTIIVDDEPWLTARTATVLVANHGTISGGVNLFPDAEPDDGLLDIAALQPESLRDWAVMSWRLLRGHPVPARLIHRTQGTSVVVRSARPRPYELDGEIRSPSSELRFEIQPGALTVHRRTKQE